MLNDASGPFDRLGRSLIDLLGTIQHLEAVGVDLYLGQQSLDTTTPP
jgi:DNA invertase Pin-like site-specific DNA recombinase